MDHQRWQFDIAWEIKACKLLCGIVYCRLANLLIIVRDDCICRGGYEYDSCMLVKRSIQDLDLEDSGTMHLLKGDGDI